MVDILVRNVEEDVAKALKDAARQAGTSVNEIARQALSARVRGSRDRLWAEVDHIRSRIGPLEGDSTAMIREDRDNDEPSR